MMTTYDYLVVGAGFFGAVVAERIANDLGRTVLVIDKRGHTGGNCHSVFDGETGIEYHPFGTHVFHTSSEDAWKYIARFTEFNGYHHQVLTTYRGKVFQMPINLETINAFYNVTFSPAQAREFIQAEAGREQIRNPGNFEDMAVSRIGRPLYEALIRSYTVKQWNKDPKELPSGTFSRLPVRFNYNEDYFLNARWQGLPLDGYAKVFERLLASERIRVELDCDYFLHQKEFQPKYKTIYTGPVDRLFDYRCGKLEWRSVGFERKTAPVEDFQGTSVMNFADAEIPFTRLHEPRHLHPERNYPATQTLLFYEKAVNGDEEGCYPVNSRESEEAVKNYQALASRREDLVVGGRLGDYSYRDMDQTILDALDCYKNRIVNNV